MASARNIFAFIVMTQMSLAFASNDVVRTISSTNDNFMLEWKHDASASKLMFKITCKGTGWCGVGFTETADGMDMVNYDIAVGGYANNAGYVKDYWSAGLGTPTLDPRAQDFMFTSASQADGKTVVEFTRSDMTNNTMNDVQFTADTLVWVVWAFHNTADVDSGITKHSAGTTGISTMKYNLIKASASIIGPSFVLCMLLVFRAFVFS